MSNEKNNKLLKNVILTHDTNHRIIPIILWFLKKLFGEKLPDGVHLVDNIAEGLKIISESEMPSVIICSGETYLDGKLLKADQFAEVIKRKSPQAVVIAYSYSAYHNDIQQKYLDGYIRRGASMKLLLSTEEYKCDMKNHEDDFPEFRMAEFIKGAYEAETFEQFKALFYSDDDVFFREKIA